MQNAFQRFYQPGRSNLELTTQFATIGLDAAKRLLRLQAETVSRSFLESTDGWRNFLAGRDPSTLLQIYQRNLNILNEARNASADVLSDAQSRVFEILNQQMAVYRNAISRSSEHGEQSGGAESAAVLEAVDATASEPAGEAVVQMVKRQA
jgi:hypothetical protein